MESVNWGNIVNDLAGGGVTFCHLPPYCPEKAGCWERLVGVTKSLILSTFATNYIRKITEGELLTFFREVQGILN